MNHSKISNLDSININEFIFKLFEQRWTGPASKSVDSAKAQLYKSLKNQIDGFWSGRTAYRIMVDGGFLVDSKFGSAKRLTALGSLFMEEYKKEIQ